MAAAPATLHDVFQTFASFGDRLSDGTYMDNTHFAKLTRDCGCALGPFAAAPPPSPALTPPPLPPHLNPVVLDAKLTPTEVDIIFSSVKAKGERRINFREFCEAVQRMAASKVRGWRCAAHSFSPHPLSLTSPQNSHNAPPPPLQK